MDHVARIVLAAQAVADVGNLVGREVGHATHPDAERPQRRHLRESRQHAVAPENLLGCAAANEEDVQGGVVVEELHRAGGVVGQRQLAVVAGMIETAVHAAAHIKGDVLIAAAVVHALSVLVLQLERLPAQVHLAETLARAHKALVRLASETDGGALGHRGRGFVLAYRTEAQGQGVIAGRREMVVAQGNALRLVAVGVEGDEGCRLRCR